jgi:hypothetical protein
MSPLLSMLVDVGEEHIRDGVLFFHFWPLTSYMKDHRCAGHQWLMPVILTTQEAEIRRFEVRSQPGEIVYETLC